jgi:lipoprotein-releasing system permease protein
MYKYFLAFRYLRRRLVSILAVLGIAVGVMVLLVVTSVMGGFARDLKAKLRGISAHISVHAPRGGFIRDYEVLCARLGKIPHVVAVSPRLEWPVLFGEEHVGCLVGIDIEREKKTTDFQDFLLGKDCGFSEDPDDMGRPPMLIGHTVKPNVDRKKYKCVWNGMQWEVFTARPAPEPVQLRVSAWRVRPSSGRIPFCQVPAGFLREWRQRTYRRLEQSRMKFFISGAYSSGISEFDNNTAFVPLEAAQELVGAPDGVTRICLAVSNYNDPVIMSSVLSEANRIAREFRAGYVNTWEQEKETLLKAVAMERGLNAIILFFIVLVAGFLILAILLMMVAEKRRDIGILRAIGAPARGILSLFLFKAGVMAVLGSCIGIGLGLLVCTYLNGIRVFVNWAVGWDPFPPDIYLLDKIPCQVEPASVVLIVVATIVSSLLISTYAAVKAALLSPATALRYE